MKRLFARILIVGMLMLTFQVNPVNKINDYSTNDSGYDEVMLELIDEPVEW